MKNFIFAMLILMLFIASLLIYSLYKENKDNIKTIEIQHEIIINFYELDAYKTELIKNYELMFEKNVDNL